jgi:transcriptional regulator with GAF, ATPase, and Fis domain
MAAIDVWFHCQDGTNQLSRDRATNALAHEGIVCRCRGASSDPPFGLIVFENESADLLAFVQRSSRDGSDRIIAVALDNAALTGATPWKLLQAGASDVLAWNSTKSPAAAIAARFQRWQAVEEVVDSELVRSSLVGRSRAWVSVLRQVVEVARYTDASVLITGESGTGKELIARLIHTLDSRIDKHSLIVLDCTTVVPELSGSEFFGHERGAFTHAVASRVGAFGLAHRGTLFLDEVGDLPLNLQAELLRVVQERTYKPVGSNVWKKVDFRLICATNRNLEEERARGTFRLDLYHRLASWTFKLPSLNERREDIIPLTHHFLREIQSKGEIAELDSAVRDYLLLRNYPGNVRDLRQLVTRMAKRHVGTGPITVGDIPEDENPFATTTMTDDWKEGAFKNAIRRALSLGATLKQISNAATEQAIRVALQDENENLQRAARKLGVTDRALQMRRASQREANEGTVDFSRHVGPV